VGVNWEEKLHISWALEIFATQRSSTHWIEFVDVSLTQQLGLTVSVDVFDLQLIGLTCTRSVESTARRIEHVGLTLFDTQLIELNLLSVHTLGKSLVLN